MSLPPNVDEQAYVKQMRNVDPNYLPLYNPNPWSEDYVYVGDVGVIQAGTFRPLFNITMKPTHRRNAGGVPENFEILPFSSSSDTSTKSHSHVVKKSDPCFGDALLTWSREEDSSTVEDEPKASEEQSSREYTRFTYTFTKPSPEASYVLLAMEDVEETVVEETRTEAWRNYMEKHHKFWLKYIRKKWRDPNFKAENLVLLCGFIKTSNWVIATLPKEGTYRLEVQDTPVGIRPTLTLGGKAIDKGLRYGQDPPEGHRELMQHFAQLAGLQVPDSREPIRKRCLFLKGFRMEKDFWLPKRIVAAAEPQDPRSSNNDSELPSSQIHTGSSRCDRTCAENRSLCRRDSEATLQTCRHFQFSSSTTAAHPSTRTLSPLAMSLDDVPQHHYSSSLSPEAPLFLVKPVVAF